MGGVEPGGSQCTSATVGGDEGGDRWLPERSGIMRTETSVLRRSGIMREGGGGGEGRGVGKEGGGQPRPGVVGYYKGSEDSDKVGYYERDRGFRRGRVL